MERGESQTGRPAFEVRTVEEEGHWRLVLSGELDLASAERLEEAIHRAEEVPGRSLVLDLSDLRFIDSTGLHVLLQAHARSRKNGRRLSVRKSKHEAVIRLLDLTSTAEILDPD
jgi:anti-sigma B factor antagonist